MIANPATNPPSPLKKQLQVRKSQSERYESKRRLARARQKHQNAPKSRTGCNKSGVPRHRTTMKQNDAVNNRMVGNPKTGIILNTLSSSSVRPVATSMAKPKARNSDRESVDVEFFKFMSGLGWLPQIKSKRGTTFAQDMSAEVEGMPLSAQASGCVDFVLPPDRMPDNRRIVEPARQAKRPRFAQALETCFARPCEQGEAPCA
jgi:hypothetical protein